MVDLFREFLEWFLHLKVPHHPLAYALYIIFVYSIFYYFLYPKIKLLLSLIFTKGEKKAEKSVYKGHFDEVEKRRKEELEKLGHYVPLELEVKLSQKGGGWAEDAITVLGKCLDNGRNAIILGASGAGKTFTFLKLFGELKERYINDEIPYIPLFIEMYKFNPANHVNLSAFIQKYIGIDENRFLKDKGKYLLFLDGLNESPDLEEAFNEVITAQPQGMRVVLSTQREEDFFKDKGFYLFDMLPLGEEEVVQYLSYCPKLDNDKEKARELYLKLDRVLQEQIKTPVFLFFFSTLYEETGTIPTNLGNLLSSFADFVCARKRTSDGLSLGTPLAKAYKEDVLPYIAFSMCKENEKALKEPELKKLFNKVIKDAPHEYYNFKKQVCQRYWLIRQSAADESFEFMYELLRNYFAAVYIKNEGMAVDEVLGLVFPDKKPNITFVSVVQLLCGIELEERVKQLITGILEHDPFIAASCFALSTTTDLDLFEEVASEININDPNYPHLDRLPHFYLRGLELLKGKEGQSEYAFYQNSLGTAYGKLSEVRDREANLGRAIDAYNEALKIRTFEKFPQDYAQTQNNLGIVYRRLSEIRDKEANLGRTIDAFKEAINIITFENFPQDHAQIQNNLGVAYKSLSEVRDKEANLERSIVANSEALKVRTFEEFPKQYAMTQENLGNTYKRLSEVRDKEANLDRAITAYRDALKVQTKEAMPWYFVEDSYSLALALDEKGDTAGALRVMEEMLPVAEEVRYPKLEELHRFYEDLKSR